MYDRILYENIRAFPEKSIQTIAKKHEAKRLFPLIKL